LAEKEKEKAKVKEKRNEKEKEKEIAKEGRVNDLSSPDP
jgi:hypothetical protein